MKQIYKLFLSLLLMLGMICTCFAPEGMAAFLNGGSQKYMYNGVVIASATYNYQGPETQSINLYWTIYDESKNARDWPTTIVVEGDTVYDTHNTGTKLCKLTVGNSYDIRVVFVHSKNKAPYYYLMIEGEGVTNLSLSGTYTDGVWISADKNSNTGKITKGDGLEATNGVFSLDYVVVTDSAADPDEFHKNHADFRTVEYKDGAICAELLWAPDSESINADNVKLINSGAELEIDKLKCEGNKIYLYSREISRGETYTLLLKDTVKTSLGKDIRIPLKTSYTVPNLDKDILSSAFSDGTFTVDAQNLSDNEFKFTVLIALKSIEGYVKEVIVSDEYTIPALTPHKTVTVDNLDFKGLTPEAYIVKSASILVPVSDRIHK